MVEIVWRLALIGILAVAAGAPAWAESGVGACELPAVVAGEPRGPEAADPATVAERAIPARQDAEVIVVGGPSGSVLVVAPPTVKATGVGGAGAPGTPGQSARRSTPSPSPGEGRGEGD